MTNHKNVYRTLSSSWADYIREMQSIVYNCREKKYVKNIKVANRSIWKLGNAKIKVISEFLVWLLCLHLLQVTMQFWHVYFIFHIYMAPAEQMFSLYQCIHRRKHIHTKATDSLVGMWVELAKSLNSCLPGSLLLTKNWVFRGVW